MVQDELINLAEMDLAELQAAATLRAEERRTAERLRQDKLEEDWRSRNLFAEAYGSGDEFLVAVMRGTHFGVEVGEIEQCRRGNYRYARRTGDCLPADIERLRAAGLNIVVRGRRAKIEADE